MSKKAKKKTRRPRGKASKKPKRKPAKKRPARKVRKKKKPAPELELIDYMDMTRAELEKLLSLEERRFCVLYTSDREFFANGTRSYAEAYGHDLTKEGAYDVCGVCASGILKKLKIIAYQSKLLEALGLNDAFVDKQLAKLIMQDGDLAAKRGAINEYNRMRGRHIKNVNMNMRGRVQVERVMFGTPVEDDSDK